MSDFLMYQYALGLWVSHSWADGTAAEGKSDLAPGRAKRGSVKSIMDRDRGEGGHRRCQLKVLVVAKGRKSTSVQSHARKY
jgi:hypothetical protein